MDYKKKYATKIQRSSIIFSCPLCTVILLPKDFNRHLLHDHQSFPTRNFCIWCRSLYLNLVDNNQHRYECCSDFLSKNKIEKLYMNNFINLQNERDQYYSLLTECSNREKYIQSQMKFLITLQNGPSYFGSVQQIISNLLSLMEVA